MQQQVNEFRDQYISSVINIILLARLATIPTIIAFSTQYFWVMLITMPLVVVAKYFCKCSVSHKAILLLIDLTVVTLGMIYRNHDWVYGVVLLPVMAGIAIPIFSRRATRIFMLGFLIFMFVFDGYLLHQILDPNHGDFDWLPHTIQFTSFTVMVMASVEIVLLLSKMLAAQVKESLAAKDAVRGFLHNMSHEIRTPLNGIMGLAQVLEQDETLGNSQRNYVTIIRNSGNHLLEIINDILSLASLERDDMKSVSAPFSPDKVIEEVSMLFSASVKQGVEISVTGRTGFQVSCDAKLFRQIISNLVGNAVKFTTRGVIEINSEVLSQNNDIVRVRYSVRDTGAGIPAHMIEKLGSPFVQVDNSVSRKTGGTGLGLSIVKRILALKNTTLDIKSAEHVGSVFSFDIEFDIVDYIPTFLDEHNPNDADFDDSVHIVIVDDVDINNIILVDLMAHLGFRNIRSFNNARDALLHIRNNRTDLLITDIQMPEMSGYDLIDAVREVLPYKLPIIVQTGNSDNITKRNCEALGVEIIHKPINRKQLNLAVLKLLK